jgi:hypothetical protein
MEATMKYKIAIWFLFVCLSSSFAFAQANINQAFPFVDLNFPEVVAGSGLETLITLSNRGTANYNGTAHLFKGKQFQWNPTVNGISITGGAFPVSILPGRTVTYLITGSSLEVGGMLITSQEADLTNYVEGNLTYFITSEGTVIDSIGVLPATPFVAASLPFDDFYGITLAFSNADFQERNADMTFKLYSDTSQLLGTYTTGSDPLLIGEQRASYLYQLFPAVSSLASGRVEIQSSIPVCGVAMTQAVGGQFSSLPLGSTIRTYNVDNPGDEVDFARIALWTNGPFVTGYLIVEFNSQQALFLVSGQISGEGSNQRLNLHFDANSEFSGYTQIYGMIRTNAPFRWSDTTFSGVYYVTFPEEEDGYTNNFTATLAIP